MSGTEDGVFPLGELQPVPNRPGSLARDLIGSRAGFTSMFVSEPGSFIPLHTHLIEEAWVVLEGALTLQVGVEVVTAVAEGVVRVAPEIPHAVRNAGEMAARGLAAAPWDRAGFFGDATTYLESQARTD